MTYSEELHKSISKRCHTDGIGCDGYQEVAAEGLVPCECACHGLYAPTFVTNDDVREWHIPSHTYRAALPEDDNRRARQGSIVASDGTVWVLLPQFRDRHD